MSRSTTTPFWWALRILLLVRAGGLRGVASTRPMCTPPARSHSGAAASLFLALRSPPRACIRMPARKHHHPPPLLPLPLSQHRGTKSYKNPEWIMPRIMSSVIFRCAWGVREVGELRVLGNRAGGARHMPLHGSNLPALLAGIPPPQMVIASQPTPPHSTHRSLIIFTLYWKKGDNLSLDNLTNIQAVLFMWVTLAAYNAATTMPILVLERHLFTRERNDGLYRVITFLVYKVIEEFIVLFLVSIAMGAWGRGPRLFQLGKGGCARRWRRACVHVVAAEECAPRRRLLPAPPLAKTSDAARHHPIAAQRCWCFTRSGSKARGPSSGSQISSPSASAQVRCVWMLGIGACGAPGAWRGQRAGSGGNPGACSGAGVTTMHAHPHAWKSISQTFRSDCLLCGGAVAQHGCGKCAVPLVRHHPAPVCGLPAARGSHAGLLALGSVSFASGLGRGVECVFLCMVWAG